MANHKQAEKRYRQSEKRRELNKTYKSKMRTLVKAVRKNVGENNAASAKKALEQAIPVIDKVAGKGIIHKNTAARIKSRLSNMVAKIS